MRPRSTKDSITELRPLSTTLTTRLVPEFRPTSMEFQSSLKSTGCSNSTSLRLFSTTSVSQLASISSPIPQQLLNGLRSMRSLAASSSLLSNFWTSPFIQNSLRVYPLPENICCTRMTRPSLSILSTTRCNPWFVLVDKIHYLPKIQYLLSNNPEPDLAALPAHGSPCSAYDPTGSTSEDICMHRCTR